MTEMRNKVHTLFGEEAQRVTTLEMESLVRQIAYDCVDNRLVFAISPTRSLPSKETHGDVDIVYVPRKDVHFGQAIKDVFKDRIVKTHSNGDVYSVLYNSLVLGKKVHVDFIKATLDTFSTKLQYFSYNDFSGIVGIFSKKLNFKYGSEGFFKRYQDKRGNWHDILISRDLMVGLKILGFDPTKFHTIQTVDDIVEFMLSSNLMDSKYLTHSEMNQSDKKSTKRPVIEYVVQKLREANKVSTELDDFYFYLHYEYLYKMVLSEADAIESNVSIKSKYNGTWVMQRFGLPAGPAVGIILKHISTVFGDTLDGQNEEVVAAEIRRQADKMFTEIKNEMNS